MSQKAYQQLDESHGDITIGDLYPELSSKQQADAEYRLLGYLSIAKRIFGRVCRDHPEILTELEERATLRKNGSFKPIQ